MRKPIIGITANERLNPEDNFAMMSYAATGFVEAVTKVGGIPVILPISDEKMARHYVSIVDKIIITGGQNVDPKFYGEEKQLTVMTITLIVIILNWQSSMKQSSRKNRFSLSAAEPNFLM